MVGTPYNRPSGFLVILCAAMLCPATFAVGEGTAPLEAQSGITVQLSLPETAFKGLPCLGTVYVQKRSGRLAGPARSMLGMSEDERKRAAAKALSEFSGFAEFDLIKGFAPFTVEFVDVETNRLQKVVRPPRGAFLLWQNEVEPPWALRPKQIRLAAGETRSFVLDFGPWLVDIPDGEYAVTVELHNLFGKKIGRSKQAGIELTSLPHDVWTGIQSGIPGLTRDGPIPRPWDWVKMKMDSGRLQKELPKEVFSQLALYCFLSDVAHERRIEKARTDLLDSVPDHLNDFATALRYEVLLAKGDKEATKKLKDAVLSKSTGIKWRFDQADAGNGLIHQVIKRISPTAGGK